MVKSKARKKTTKYQRLQKAASTYCKTGSMASKERLKKAEKAYRDDAKKKGKTAAEINKSVSRVKKCSTSNKK